MVPPEAMGLDATPDGAVRKPVLVTGGTGFTGGHLCERLRLRGDPVRALVRDPHRCGLLHRWGVETVQGDLRDPGSLARAMEGCDVVYHIGASFRHENISDSEMRAINVQGTKNVLDAAIRHAVRRVVHCSTVGVHGHIRNPPATERAPYGPHDRYQESKLEAEQLALKYAVEGRLPVVVFRPASIYGPRDLRFLKLFKAIKNGRFAMLGSGEVWFHMIYIEDLVDGILLCGTNARAIGNAYILAGEEPCKLNDLVSIIAEVLEVARPNRHIPFMPIYLLAYVCEVLCRPLKLPPPLYRRRVAFFRNTRWFDTSKARNELGFRPRVDLKTGIRLTAEWYRSEGLL